MSAGVPPKRGNSFCTPCATKTRPARTAARAAPPLHRICHLHRASGWPDRHPKPALARDHCATDTLYSRANYGPGRRRVAAIFTRVTSSPLVTRSEVTHVDSASFHSHDRHGGHRRAWRRSRMTGSPVCSGRDIASRDCRPAERRAPTKRYWRGDPAGVHPRPDDHQSEQRRLLSEPARRARGVQALSRHLEPGARVPHVADRSSRTSKRCAGGWRRSSAATPRRWRSRATRARRCRSRSSASTSSRATKSSRRTRTTGACSTPGSSACAATGSR